MYGSGTAFQSPIPRGCPSQKTFALIERDTVARLVPKVRAASCQLRRFAQHAKKAKTSKVSGVFHPPMPAAPPAHHHAFRSPDVANPQRRAMPLSGKSLRHGTTSDYATTSQQGTTSQRCSGIEWLPTPFQPASPQTDRPSLRGVYLHRFPTAESRTLRCTSHDALRPGSGSA